MPVDGTISPQGDSASNSEKSNWKFIGDLAADIVAKKHASFDGETASDIAAWKAATVITSLEVGDIAGAKMATTNLIQFFSEYEAAQNG